MPRERSSFYSATLPSLGLDRRLRFRAMAQDMVEVMENLGHQRFFPRWQRPRRAHEPSPMPQSPRSGREALPLDGLPNYHVWTYVDKKWAINDWHGSFMAQPEPFPETLMSAVPADWFLRNRGGGKLPKVVFDECVRCFTKKTITGSCRDYRAGATYDFETDTADKDRKIGMPLLLLIATRGEPPSEELPTVWRKFASNLLDAQPLPTGHHMQEDAPDQVYDRFVKFFTA